MNQSPLFTCPAFQRYASFINLDFFPSVSSLICSHVDLFIHLSNKNQLNTYYVPYSAKHQGYSVEQSKFPTLLEAIALVKKDHP